MSRSQRRTRGWADRRGPRPWIAGALLASGLVFSACSRGSGTATAEADGPAKVEDIAGQVDIKLVSLTPEATKRIGLETGVVREVSDPAGGAAKKVLPYSSLIYDAEGNTFAYTVREEGQFVRAPLTVVRISLDEVIVSEGPATGTKVVTVGAAELLGTEYGVGED